MILLTAYVDVGFAGFYALARVAQEFPVNLLSGSLGTIFYGEASRRSKIKFMGTQVAEQARSICKLLFVFVLPSYLIVSAWAPEIFQFIFGKDWKTSGVLFLILLPVSLFSLLSCWLNRTFEIFKLQKVSFKIQLIWEITGFIIGGVLLILGINLFIVVAVMISIFSLVPISSSYFSFRWIGVDKKQITVLLTVMICFSAGNALISGLYLMDDFSNVPSYWLFSTAGIFCFLGLACFRTSKFKTVLG